MCIRHFAHLLNPRSHRLFSASSVLGSGIPAGPANIKFRQNRGYDNQYDYLVDKDGNIMIDHVIRYENLKEDFKKFASTIDLTYKELPILNQTKKVNYRDIHTTYTKEITAKVYNKEIELLNYKF